MGLSLELNPSNRSVGFDELSAAASKKDFFCWFGLFTFYCLEL
jgi:hypothetical protein